MTDFPLYTTLLSSARTCSKKDLTVLQKNELVKFIEETSEEALELIYVLIKCYALDSKLEDKIPFGGKNQGAGIEFDLINLPVELRQVLYKFMVMHRKKLIEDQAIHALKKEN